MSEITNIGGTEPPPALIQAPTSASLAGPTPSDRTVVFFVRASPARRSIMPLPALPAARPIDGCIEYFGVGHEGGSRRGGLAVGPSAHFGAGVFARPDARHHDKEGDNARRGGANAQLPASDRRTLFSGRHAASPMGRQLWRPASCVPY